MADTLTTHFNWVMPQDQASNDTWGAKINADLQAIDSQIWLAFQSWNSAAAYNVTYTHQNLNLQSSASGGATISLFNSLAPVGHQQRWQFGSDNTSETGGNAGSNFFLTSYSDTGTVLGTPIAVTRSNGSVSLGIPGSTITFNGTASFQQSLSSAGPFNCGSPLTIAADSTGLNASIHFPSTFIPDPSTGGDTISWGSIATSQNRFTIYGPGLSFISPSDPYDTNQAFITFQHPSSGFAEGSVMVSPGLSVGVAVAPTDPSLFLAQGGVLWCNGPGSSNSWAGLSFIQNTSNPNQVRMVLGGGSGGFLTSLTTDFSGNFIYSGAGNALKTGGGPWGAISDARVKDVISEYDLGLEAVTQLRPVVYRYNGRDGPLADPDAHFVGLIAQEVEEVMPGMVTQGEGEIDGEKVSDLRTLDTTELIFSLVNCIKELSARIRTLEAKVG